MKSIIVASALLASSSAFAAAGTAADPHVFILSLSHEVQQPMGTKNGCVYGGNNGIAVVVLAPDANKACHKSITWKEWDFSETVRGETADCSYTFTEFGRVLTHDFSDHVTSCYSNVRIQFHAGIAI